jgi:transcriptional regulator with XRE-family HTH domain
MPVRLVKQCDEFDQRNAVASSEMGRWVTVPSTMPSVAPYLPAPAKRRGERNRNPSQPPIGSYRLCVLLNWHCKARRLVEKMPDRRKMPTATDTYVGERVRMQRIMIHMSQDTLGKKLGLTFQQIQKYEKGTNRLGASRLHQISEILGVPVSFLFEGLPGQESRASQHSLPKYLVEFMGTAFGQRLVEALGRISDKDVRSHLVQLAESIADIHAPAPKRTKRRKSA